MTNPDSDLDQTKVLLERHCAGDSAAIESILLRDLSWVREFVHRHLGSEVRRLDDTSDVVQEVMLSFLRYGQRIVVASKDEFRRLVATIALNRIRSAGRRLRTPARDSAKERDLHSDSVLYLSGDSPVRCVTRPDVGAERAEAVALVRLAKELLQPEVRETLELRESGLTFAEVGRLLACTEEAARKRFNKAVQQLERTIVVIRAGRLRTLLPA